MHPVVALLVLLAFHVGHCNAKVTLSQLGDSLIIETPKDGGFLLNSIDMLRFMQLLEARIDAMNTTIINQQHTIESQSQRIATLEAAQLGTQATIDQIQSEAVRNQSIFLAITSLLQGNLTAINSSLSMSMSDQALLAMNISLISANLTSGPKMIANIRVFNVSSTYNPPPNLLFVIVEVIGGGGGGGNNNFAGGSGAYSRSAIVAKDLPSTVNVTVGKGGAVGGDIGGITMFGDFVTAGGGQAKIGGTSGLGQFTISGADFISTNTGADSVYGGGGYGPYATTPTGYGSGGYGFGSSGSAGAAGVCIVTEYLSS